MLRRCCPLPIVSAAPRLFFNNALEHGGARGVGRGKIGGYVLGVEGSVCRAAEGCIKHRVKELVSKHLPEIPLNYSDIPSAPAVLHDKHGQIGREKAQLQRHEPSRNERWG